MMVLVLFNGMRIDGSCLSFPGVAIGRREAGSLFSLYRMGVEGSNPVQRGGQLGPRFSSFAPGREKKKEVMSFTIILVLIKWLCYYSGKVENDHRER